MMTAQGAVINLRAFGVHISLQLFASLWLNSFLLLAGINRQPTQKLYRNPTEAVVTVKLSCPLIYSISARTIVRAPKK
jgi:hypothetical protein